MSNIDIISMKNQTSTLKTTTPIISHLHLQQNHSIRCYFTHETHQPAGACQYGYLILGRTSSSLQGRPRWCKLGHLLVMAFWKAHSEVLRLIRLLYIYMYIHTLYIIYNRRKFRSQTSDNMDRWKAEQGRGREKRKIRREKIRRERVRRKKMQMREKVGKSRNTVFSNDLGLRRVEK